jgi:protein-tyrosine-phosphatase
MLLYSVLSDKMGETTYILIDESEKRVKIDHYGSLNAFVASLSKNPATIEEFHQFYQEITGEKFYDEGNRPKVPEELSVDTIKKVLGMEGSNDDEVLEYWMKVSLYDDINYKSFAPDEASPHDIPKLTQEIIDEWKQEDPSKEEFKDANEYRRHICNDGIVVADLRKKGIRYITHGTFSIPRERPTENDKQFGYDVISYSLPSEWKIIEE